MLDINVAESFSEFFDAFGVTIPFIYKTEGTERDANNKVSPKEIEVVMNVEIIIVPVSRADVIDPSGRVINAPDFEGYLKYPDDDIETGCYFDFEGNRLNITDVNRIGSVQWLSLIHI